MYGSPGNVDTPSTEVLDAWNRRISDSFNRLGGLADPTFIKRAPGDVPGGMPTSAVKWRGSPAEPRFCLGEDWAEKLSNWGVVGRHQLQNEYLEFAVVFRPDAAGNVRPKRFIATTELREYWVTLAVTSPDELAAAAEDVLGRAPSWEELYGEGVQDPSSLSARQREELFARQVAGSGNDPSLPSDIPGQPEGDLNRKNLLFMSHPINGLDDLIYIVAFGAHPYVVREGTGFRPATLTEIFIDANVKHLACRNADPAAAQGAFNQVLKPGSNPFAGTSVAFADPLGMYIRSFKTAGFTFNGQPVPAEWTVKRRGAQRLEFGPPDGEDIFLDDILVEAGASTAPLRAGYQLAKLIEVGPELIVGSNSVIPQTALQEIPASSQQLDCAQAAVCDDMRALKRAYENQGATPGVRGGQS